MNLSRANISKTLTAFAKSIWFFPVILLIPVIILTSLEISGSSIGVYHSYFYGNTKDNNLLANKPRAIRSDEWIVNTQMTIAQKNNNYSRINNNIGNGQDFSLLIDAPYRDWSILFKPHNIAFFIMPFDNAFAFRWWLMAYLLIISCYFFVISILPNKKSYGIILGISLFFSPFIQWWYLYGTMATIYFSFFTAILLIKILQNKKSSFELLLSLLLTYVLVCFAFILYPPFQIPAVIAIGAFGIGFMLIYFKGLDRKFIIKKISYILIACVVALAITTLFLLTRISVVKTIQNTAYPGERIEQSGRFEPQHLLSSHLATQFQYDRQAKNYQKPAYGLVNQSESSNFLLLMPYLLLPSLFLLYQNKRKRLDRDWPLIFVNSAIIIILVWLFVPGLGMLGKITFFDKVPATRFLIGLGILNTLQLALFIKNYATNKKIIIGRSVAFIYSLICFIVSIFIGLAIIKNSPLFIGVPKMIVLSAILPLVTFLLLRKKTLIALLIFLAFSILSTFKVNPLYKNTSIISETALSQAVRQEAGTNDGRWVTDESMLENISALNGVPSLSGVFAYPQLELWRPINGKESIYNRYAHTNFVFDRDVTKTIGTSLTQAGGDNFGVVSEPCSQFIKGSNIKFIITATKFNTKEDCLTQIRKIKYPAKEFYIYKIM